MLKRIRARFYIWLWETIEHNTRCGQLERLLEFVRVKAKKYNPKW